MRKETRALHQRDNWFRSWIHRATRRTVRSEESGPPALQIDRQHNNRDQLECIVAIAVLDCWISLQVDFGIVWASLATGIVQ